MPIAPTLSFEIEAKNEGYAAIVGVDEAGAGALAGPVVAGAVLLHEGQMIEGIADSKTMTEKRRDAAYSEIITSAKAWAFGMATHEEIDRIGIRPANYLAMRRAIAKINDADFVLVDAWTIPHLALPQKGIIRGDKQVASIAAASIVAKVTRDKMMTDFHNHHPKYGFDRHKGYGTKAHRAAIVEHGPCDIHRTSFTLV